MSSQTTVDLRIPPTRHHATAPVPQPPAALTTAATPPMRCIAIIVAVLLVMIASLTALAATPEVPLALRSVLNNILTSAAAGVCACSIMAWRLDLQAAAYLRTARTLTNTVSIDVGHLAAQQEQTVAQVARLVGALRSRAGEAAVDGTVVGDLATWLAHIDTTQRQLPAQLQAMVKTAVQEVYAQGAVDTLLKARQDSRPALRSVD